MRLWRLVPWGVLVAIGLVTGAAAQNRSALYIVKADHWSGVDERGYRDFVQAIGESDCGTLDACLKSAVNPYRSSDPPGYRFESDCADLPYVLRFYYAWKNGLPFSFESALAPRDPRDNPDLRYSLSGNVVTARTDVPSGKLSGMEILARIRAAVSSASYRIHPNADAPLAPDFYSAAIDPHAIGPGTVVYDPAGHVAIVYRVDSDGRVHLFDAHTDFSLTEMTYDLRFARDRPAVGAGFRNWRPLRLVGATRDADGNLTGGRAVLASNKDIADFSDEQYYGNGKRPSDEDWRKADFVFEGQSVDYFDYVRAKLAGGKLAFDPVKEMDQLVASNCADLHYREDAVAIAIRRNLESAPQPARFPRNIYGAEAEWETYSTPSRDARLKVVFKWSRDLAERFVQMYARRDPRLLYEGDDLIGDMLKHYDRVTGACLISYARSDGSRVSFGYDDARRRLFAMSFDPYHCVERRWGATDPAELSTCRDDQVKEDWYSAERRLRNQTERTYDLRMGFTLDELRASRLGADAPPDTDVRAYLVRMQGTEPGYLPATRN